MKMFRVLTFFLCFLTVSVCPSSSCYTSYVPDKSMKQQPNYNISDFPWHKKEWFYFNGERVSPSMRSYRSDCECGLNIFSVKPKPVDLNPSPGEFPWTVWFKTASTNGQTCGGSIIADRMILTAAHCVTNLDDYDKPFKANEFLIYINTTNLTTPEMITTVKAVEFHAHPLFLKGLLSTATENSTVFYGNDIAVIILERPIQFASPQGPQPICLPNIGRVDVKADMVANVVGYDNQSLSNTLQRTSVSIIDIDECSKQIASNSKNFLAFDKTSVICAGADKYEGNFANGDSGGPLFLRTSRNNIRMTQIGIMSGSDSEFRKDGDPVYFYTKVEAHLPIIDYYAKKYKVKWCSLFNARQRRSKRL